MNNRSENTNTASFDEHSRAESWDSNDRLETESSAANVMLRVVYLVYKPMQQIKFRGKK